MQKNKIRNVAIGVLNTFIVVSLVFVLVLKNDYGYSLYWTITPFLVVLVISVIQKWSARGLNVDTEESKVIQRSFDDITTLSTVFFGLVYLIIQGIDVWKDNIINNSFVIVGFFIVMVVYELFTYLAIYNAKKETAKLLEKKYNKKK